MSQLSDEIEGRVAKKSSQEFNRTEIRILGALSKLDEFVLNPQLGTQSGTVPGISWITEMENQEPNEVRSPNDPRSEVRFSVYWSPQSVDSDPDKAPYSFISDKSGANEEPS